MRSLTTKIMLALALAGATVSSFAVACLTALPAVTSAAEVSPAPPHVTTGGVTHVNGTSADLEGIINTRTLAATYYFVYGPTSTYGSQTPTQTLPAGNNLPVRVSQPVSGLLSGYHYRLVAINSAGAKKEGKDRVYIAKLKSKKAQFELPSTIEPIVLGQVFVLSGSLKGTDSANRAIVLQASTYPYTAAYATIGGPVLTSATGAFSFRVANLAASTRFRVATVAATGAVPIYSKLVTEPVEVRVSLKVRTTSRKKGLVRLYGTVTPAETGAHIYFQLERTRKPKPVKSGKPESEKKTEKAEERAEKGPIFATTRFSTVVKPATKTLSRFSVVVQLKDAGRYRAFVELKPGPLASGYSQPVLIRTVEPKTKKKKKS